MPSFEIETEQQQRHALSTHWALDRGPSSLLCKHTNSTTLSFNNVLVVGSWPLLHGIIQYGTRCACHLRCCRHLNDKSRRDTLEHRVPNGNI